MLRRVVRLPAADRRLVVEALLFQSVIAVVLRLMSFGRLRRLLERLSRPPLVRQIDPGAGPQAGRVPWAVSVSSRCLGPASTCLTEALTTAALLRRRGCAARVAIGVRPPEGDRLTAHAWVESGEAIVFGGGSSEGSDVIARLDVAVHPGASQAG